MRPILIEIQAGELLDRISILKLKAGRMGDSAQSGRVWRELEALLALRRGLPEGGEVEALAGELGDVNARLWEVEDELRLCEKGEEFGERFVGLARSVYALNDRRAGLKRRINAVCGLPEAEEKVYAGVAGGLIARPLSLA